MELSPTTIFTFVLIGIGGTGVIVCILHSIVDWALDAMKKSWIKAHSQDNNLRSGGQIHPTDLDLEAGIDPTTPPPAYCPARNTDLEEIMGLVTPPPPYVEQSSHFATPPPAYFATATATTLIVTVNGQTIVR
jgi:hypothetical protein